MLSIIVTSSPSYNITYTRNEGSNIMRFIYTYTDMHIIFNLLQVSKLGTNA